MLILNQDDEVQKRIFMTEAYCGECHETTKQECLILDSRKEGGDDITYYRCSVCDIAREELTGFDIELEIYET